MQGAHATGPISSAAGGKARTGAIRWSVFLIGAGQGFDSLEALIKALLAELGG